MSTLEHDKIEREGLLAFNNSMFIETPYEFLNGHNGLRPGKIHTFLGSSGSGKSTLIRGLIHGVVDKMNSEENILLWLSEETREDFMGEWYLMKEPKNSKNVSVYSELELPDIARSDRMAWMYFVEQIEKLKPSVIVFDNLTTSMFYNDKKAESQSKVISCLKKIARDKGVAVVLVAHTNADVTENYNGIINANNVRGSKNIVNYSEFFYVMQRFKIGSTFFPTIRIEKHRSQAPDEKLYMLKYDSSKRCYGVDNSMTFERFKEIFSLRNTLARGSK